MREEQTIELVLTENVKIQFNRSGRPIGRYSVLLLALVEGNWETVRLFDNHLGTHHMHRYTRTGGKQDPERFYAGPTNAAIPAAIGHLKSHWEAIIESWKS